jgi:hypothetical protein
MAPALPVAVATLHSIAQSQGAARRQQTLRYTQRHADTVQTGASLEKIWELVRVDPERGGERGLRYERNAKSLDRVRRCLEKTAQGLAQGLGCSIDDVFEYRTRLQAADVNARLGDLSPTWARRVVDHCPAEEFSATHPLFQEIAAEVLAEIRDTFGEAGPNFATDHVIFELVVFICASQRKKDKSRRKTQGRKDAKRDRETMEGAVQAESSRAPRAPRALEPPPALPHARADPPACCNVLVDGMNVMKADVPCSQDFDRLAGLLGQYNGTYRIPEGCAPQEWTGGMHAVAILPAWMLEQRRTAGTVIGQRAFELRQLGWAVFVDTDRDGAADDLAGIAMTADCAVPMVTNDQLGDHARRARSMDHRRAFEDAVLAAEVRIAHNGRAAVEPPEDARLPGYRPAADTRSAPPDYTHATWLPARRQMAAAWRDQAAARAAARWCARHLGKTITPEPEGDGPPGPGNSECPTPRAQSVPTESCTPPTQSVPAQEARASPGN